MRVSSREYKFHAASREDLECSAGDENNHSTGSYDLEEDVTHACHEFAIFLADVYEIFLSWAISRTGHAAEGKIHARLSGEVWIPIDFHLVRLVAILILALLAPLLLLIAGFYVSFTIPQGQCCMTNAKRIQMLLLFCTSAGVLGMPWIGIYQLSQGEQLWHAAGREALCTVELVGPFICSVLLAAMFVDQVLEQHVEEAMQAELSQTFLEIADTVSPGLAADWNKIDLAALHNTLMTILGKKIQEGNSAFLRRRTSNHGFCPARGPKPESAETEMFYESHLETYLLHAMAALRTLEQEETEVQTSLEQKQKARRQRLHNVAAQLQSCNHRGGGGDIRSSRSSKIHLWDRPADVTWILLAATTQAFLPIFCRFWKQGCSSLQPSQLLHVQALRASYVLASFVTMVIYLSWATTTCSRLWQLKLKVLTMLYLSATPQRRRHLLTYSEDDFQNVFYYRQARGGLLGSLSHLHVVDGDEMDKGDNNDIRTPLSQFIHTVDIYMSIGLVGKVSFVNRSESGFVCNLGHVLDKDPAEQQRCYVCVRQHTEYSCPRCLNFLCRACVEETTHKTNPIVYKLQSAFRTWALIGLSPRRFLLIRKCWRAVASIHGMQAQSITGIAAFLITSNAVAVGVTLICLKKVTTGLIVCVIGFCLDMCVIVMISVSLIRLNRVMQVVTQEVIHGWRTRIDRLHASVQGFVDGNASDRLTIDSRFDSIQHRYDFAINYLEKLELPVNIYEIPVTYTFCTKMLMILGSAVLSSICTYAVQHHQLQSFATVVWTQ